MRATATSGGETGCVGSRNVRAAAYADAANGPCPDPSHSISDSDRSPRTA